MFKTLEAAFKSLGLFQRNAVPQELRDAFFAMAEKIDSQEEELSKLKARVKKLETKLKET